jgi:hypothetical protein
VAVTDSISDREATADADLGTNETAFEPESRR